MNENPNFATRISCAGSILHLERLQRTPAAHCGYDTHPLSDPGNAAASANSHAVTTSRGSDLSITTTVCSGCQGTLPAALRDMPRPRTVGALCLTLETSQTSTTCADSPPSACTRSSLTVEAQCQAGWTNYPSMSDGIWPSMSGTSRPRHRSWCKVRQSTRRTARPATRPMARGAYLARRISRTSRGWPVMPRAISSRC